MDTHTKSNPPPEKSFWEPLSDHEGKPRSPEKVSEKGFSGFRKTAPMLFYPKPRDAPPLSFHPPQAKTETTGL